MREFSDFQLRYKDSGKLRGVVLYSFSFSVACLCAGAAFKIGQGSLFGDLLMIVGFAFYMILPELALVPFSPNARKWLHRKISGKRFFIIVRLVASALALVLLSNMN